MIERIIGGYVIIILGWLFTGAYKEISFLIINLFFLGLLVFLLLFSLIIFLISRRFGNE